MGRFEKVKPGGHEVNGAQSSFLEVVRPVKNGYKAPGSNPKHPGITSELAGLLSSNREKRCAGADSIQKSPRRRMDCSRT